VLKSLQFNEIVTPGGALNVAYQLINCCKTVSFGIIDQEAVSEISLDISGCVNSELNIPRKIREI
jgi:hypothetical protein